MREIPPEIRDRATREAIVFRLIVVYMVVLMIVYAVAMLL